MALMRAELAGIKAAAFDFDGTAAKSDEAYAKARKLAFGVMSDETGDPSWAEVSDEIHESAFHSAGSTDSLEITEWAAVQGGVILPEDPVLRREIMQRAYDHREGFYDLAAELGLDQIPGSVDFIKKAAGALSGRIALVTTASIKHVEPFTRRHGIEDILPADRIFDRTLVEFRLRKDNPYAYYLALWRLGMIYEPGKVLAVEDHPKGVRAARRANLRVFGLATPHTKDDLAKMPAQEKPHVIVESFEELSDYVDF